LPVPQKEVATARSCNMRRPHSMKYLPALF